MNPYFNKLLFAAVAIAATLTIQVFSTSVSAAGPSLGFPSGKPYYGSSNQRASQSRMRPRPMYRSSEPAIVRTERAPDAVAQAPTDERSYSYEPSHQAMSGGCGCQGSVATEHAPATAQRSTDTGRSFSYEPSTSDSYSAPRMQRRSSRNSDRPTYLLPKGDPNRYRVN